MVVRGGRPAHMHMVSSAPLCLGSSSSPKGYTTVSHTSTGAKATTFDMSLLHQLRDPCWVLSPGREQGAAALGGYAGTAVITASLPSSFSPSHGAQEAAYCNGQP